MPTLYSNNSLYSTPIPIITTSTTPNLLSEFVSSNEVNKQKDPSEYYAKELEKIENKNSKNLCEEKHKEPNKDCIKRKYIEAEEFDQHNMVGNEEIEDNMEMCNSPRLNQLIKEVIRFRKL